MDKKRLAEIRARAEAATREPLVIEETGECATDVYRDGPPAFGDGVAHFANENHLNNARFFVQGPADVLALVDEATRLQARVAQLESALGDILISGDALEAERDAA